MAFGLLIHIVRWRYKPVARRESLRLGWHLLEESHGSFAPSALFGFPQVSRHKRQVSVVECQYYVDQDKLPSKDAEIRAKFQSDLMSAFYLNTLSDVTFTVQGEQFKAHKAILVARSDYFSTMFNCGMTESKSNQIEIPDIEPTVFEALLKFLYGSIPYVRESEEWMELLVAADKYNVRELKDLCESIIDHRSSDV